MRMLTMALVTGGALLAGAAGESAAWLPSATTLVRWEMLTTAQDGFREVPPAPWNAADPADSLYRQAREALNRSDYARAATLFRRIRSEHPRSTYAADAYYWEAFALYRRGGSENLRRAQEALEAQRDRFPRASTRGDADALQARIEGALASGGDAGAARDLVDRGNSIAAGGCPDEDDDERIAALNALLQMDADRAVPILEKVLARRDECSVPLRRKAVFLLAQKQDRNTEDALLRVVNSDPDAEVREQAVFWLSQVSTDRAVEVLEQLLANAKEEGIREKAIFALSQQMENPRAAQALRSLAAQNGAPSELREKAIFWLGQSGRSNAPFLMDLYRRLDDEELKEKVIFSISQMNSDSSRRWLMGVATDANEPIEMRKKSIFWVAQSGESLDELFDLYARMGDRELKEQLIFAYSQRRETRAVDKLMEIARTEQDRELRKKAVFWLSQSRDPRVADFLLQVIDQ